MSAHAAAWVDIFLFPHPKSSCFFFIFLIFFFKKPLTNPFSVDILDKPL